MMTRHLPGSAIRHGSEVVLNAWRFDLPSALIGAVLALILIGLAYHFRDRLQAGWQATKTPFQQISRFFQANAADRFLEQTIAYAQSLSTPSLIPLDAAFIEPRLQPYPSPPRTMADVEALSPPPPSLPLSRIFGDHPLLLIVGPPGAGKTSALACIATDCARVLQDEAHTPHVKLDHKRLPVYVSLLALAQTTAAQQAAEIEATETKTTEETNANTPQEKDAPEPSENGDETTEEAPRPLHENPLGHLVEAAIATIDGGQTMRMVLQQGLEAGRAIILIDGWADVPPQRRAEIAAWLSALIDQLPGNWWLACADERGYAPLTEIGFAPLELRPWDNRQIEQFASRWATIDLSTKAFRRANISPGDEERPPTFARQLTAHLQHKARAGASPFDLALSAFTYCVDGRPASTSADRYTPTYRRALELLLPPEEEKGERNEEGNEQGNEQEGKKSWLTKACQQTLARIAFDLWQEEKTHVTGEALKANIQAVLPPAEELPARAERQVFKALTTGQTGLLRPLGTERYLFRHALWQAYLAARQIVTLEELDEETLTRLLDPQRHDPRIAALFRLYAEIGDITPLATIWMRGQDDIFRSNSHILSAWIRVAPKDAAWLKGAMAILAKSFLKPHLPLRIRKTLAQALAATGISGVNYLFRQGLQQDDETIRIAAAWGLSRTASEADFPALESALQDNSPAVRETTIWGLSELDAGLNAGLNADAAARLLARILLEGDEALSLLAGEALGRCGEEGGAILKEAIGLEDVIARRAAVAGLAQMEARDLLQKVAREDEQWIVRSAASAALEEMEAQQKIFGVEAPVELDQLPWLISWAASQGESVGVGDAARRTLWRALAEGDPPIRNAAARTLAQVGRAEDLEPLQAALGTTNRELMDAVLEALAHISRRYDVRVTSAKRPTQTTA